MPFNYTFRADDLESIKSEDRDLLENRDRELELYLNQPTLKIQRVATQGILGSNAGTISWDQEDDDPQGFFTPTSTDITVPTGLGGLYAIGVRISQTSAGQSAVRISVNSTSNVVAADQSLAGGEFVGTGTNVYLQPADVIRVRVNNLETTSRSYTGILWMTRLMA